MPTSTSSRGTTKKSFRSICRKRPEATDMESKGMKRQTDRRAFLAGAGKCGALALGATYLAGMPARPGVASAQGVDTEEFPVEEKDVVRLLGVVQRRGGLTK